MARSPGAGTLSTHVAVALGLAALAGGCAPTSVQGRSTVRLLAEARAEGLAFEDPLAINSSMKAAVDGVISRSSRPEERFRLVGDFVRGRLGFRYATNRSLTAERAFSERSGDCISYSNLVVALARYLGLEAYFVYVREVHDYYERGDWFFVSSHVAVGYGAGPNAQVVDLSQQLSRWRTMSDWKLVAYKTIPDDDALALYYNNIAVDRMLASDMLGAERMLRFWLAREPDVVELSNNLGVLLNRQGRYAEAQQVIGRALDLFPTFKPLYTNGITAARGTGQRELATKLARRGEALDATDPFFTFARALKLYHEDAYGEAARELERARAAKPDSPVILAWLTRAYFLSGQREQGIQTFAEVQQLRPHARILRDLAAQFPELQ